MKPEQLDLQDVRCFVEVYESIGFTAAAKALGIAQSNVSYRVCRLERQLRAKLFRRGMPAAPSQRGRGIAPTAYADRLYRSAVMLLNEVRRFAETA